MPQAGKKQRKVQRVMHEFKHGDLKSRSGGKVRGRKQAIAIAMSESGQSRNKSGQRSAAKSARGRSSSRAASRGRTATSRRSKSTGGRKAGG